MCSRPPHNCITVISQHKKYENDSEMCKNENCWCKACKTTVFIVKCRKIPKVSPGAYIWGTHLWRVLYYERTYKRRKICVTNSIWLAYGWEEIYVLLYCLCFVLSCISGQFPTKSPRGLYSEGRFNGGFVVLRVWGAYTWRGLLFGILRYANLRRSCGLDRRSCLGSLLFGSYCQWAMNQVFFAILHVPFFYISAFSL